MAQELELAFEERVPSMIMKELIQTAIEVFLANAWLIRRFSRISFCIEPKIR